MRSTARAVLFDLDGTLVDSAGGIAAALNDTLAARKLGAFETAAVADMVGGGVRRLIERATGRLGIGEDPCLVDALLEEFLVVYRATPCRNSPLYPNAGAALAELTERGLKLAVVTNKPDDISRAMLAELGLAPLLTSIVGSLPGRALKPAPDMLAIALADLGVGAADAVMVGDSAADVGAARSAGLPVILLAHGYGHGDITQLGADMIVRGFAALPAALAALQQ